MSYFILVLFVLRAIKPRQLLFDIKYIFFKYEAQYNHSTNWFPMN